MRDVTSTSSIAEDYIGSILAGSKATKRNNPSETRFSIEQNPEPDPRLREVRKPHPARPLVGSCLRLEKLLSRVLLLRQRVNVAAMHGEHSQMSGYAVLQCSATLEVRRHTRGAAPSAGLLFEPARSRRPNAKCNNLHCTFKGWLLLMAFKRTS